MVGNIAGLSIPKLDWLTIAIPVTVRGASPMLRIQNEPLTRALTAPNPKSSVVSSTSGIRRAPGRGGPARPVIAIVAPPKMGGRRRWARAARKRIGIAALPVRGTSERWRYCTVGTSVSLTRSTASVATADPRVAGV